MILYNCGITIPFLQILLGGLANMKTFFKRLLAVSLSATLLIGCAISGLVLPVAAENVVVEGENLITNSDLSLELTGGGSQAPTFNLSQPLEEGKRYVLRFKMSGGKGQIWNSNSGNIDTVTETKYAKIALEAPAEGCWNEFFLFFYVKSKMQEFKGLYFYDSAKTENVTVTYKDFAIYEYGPGLNLVPGSDGSAFPITVSTDCGGEALAARSFFGNFTMSLATDGDNAVWKISGLSATTATNKYVRDIHTASLLKNSGKQVVVSFRFKGANGGTVVPTVKAVSGITLNSTNTSSEPDANGYKIFTANMTLKDSGWSSGYTYQLGFSGDTEVYVDDYFYGEYVEEPEEPIVDFSIEMLGLSIHWPNGVEATQANADGVRFGARLYFGEGFPTINEETGMLQLPYGGEYCDVVSVGTLLRRHADGDLTVANATWKSEAYSSTTNKFKCIVKTDTYLDFAVNMMAGENVSTEVFNARNYDARGYVQLSNGEIIYTGVVTNGIDAYFATRQ